MPSAACRMREAASRGFWVSTYAPYGYKKVQVADGAKKRPRLALNPPADAVVRRIFDMTLQGRTALDITRVLNAEGIPTANGKRWLKTTVHTILTNEAYTGTLVWGTNAKDKAPPVRVEDAFPAIVTREEFERAKRLLQSRAPKHVHPRRASSPCLLTDCSSAKLAARLSPPPRPRAASTPTTSASPHQARQGVLRHPQAQCQAIRGADRGPASGPHSH